MTPKGQFITTLLALIAILVDSLGLLTTSIVGRVLEDSDKMKDSYFAYLLIPVYVGVLIYFIQIMISRIEKMVKYCSMMSILHMICDLSSFSMEFLIILGICLSLIEGEIYSAYRFDVVVLVYGIYKFFNWIRTIIGGFADVGYYEGEFFHGKDVMPEDKDQKKKVQARATFLFKKSEIGFSINKRNFSQITDLSKLFISIACLAIWADFDDPSTISTDLFHVFVATLFWAILYFVFHMGLYIYLQHEMKDLGSNELMEFVFTMVFVISILKGFLVATLIGTLHGAADYLEEESAKVFNYSVALSVLLVFKILSWIIMYAKIYYVTQSG